MSFIYSKIACSISDQYADVNEMYDIIFVLFFFFLSKSSIFVGTAYVLKKNIREDTQEMPQSQNTAFRSQQKKEIYGTNNDQNVIYETTDAQIKKNRNRGTEFERLIETKCLGAKTSFSRELKS